MTRWLLIVAAVLAWQGVILFGLGVTNWLARNLRDAAALTAVLGGNLVVQLLSLGVAARALLLHIFPPQAAPAIAIHIPLGAALAAALVRERRTTAASPSPRAA